MADKTSLANNVTNLSNVLRDAGVSYGDYLEQITYLIFLKMAHEYSKPPFNRDLGLPADCSWDKLEGLSGEPLEEKYVEILKTLGSKTGIIGEIFKGSQNKIDSPALLARTIKMIGTENWSSLSAENGARVWVCPKEYFTKATISVNIFVFEILTSSGFVKL